MMSCHELLVQANVAAKELMRSIDTEEWNASVDAMLEAAGVESGRVPERRKVTIGVLYRWACSVVTHGRSPELYFPFYVCVCPASTAPAACKGRHARPPRGRACMHAHFPPARHVCRA